MASKELILQAIESAKCRIYKLNFDLNGELSAHHQKKAENQKELMEVTVEALEKQIPKKPIEDHTFDFCPVCSYSVDYLRNYCKNCGQALDWSESDGQLENNN